MREVEHTEIASMENGLTGDLPVFSGQIPCASSFFCARVGNGLSLCSQGLGIDDRVKSRIWLCIRVSVTVNACSTYRYYLQHSSDKSRGCWSRLTLLPAGGTSVKTLFLAFA